MDRIVRCSLSQKINASHISERQLLLAIGERFEGSLSNSKQTGPEFSYWCGESGTDMLASA